MDIYLIDVSEINNIPQELLNEFDYKHYKNQNKKQIHCFTYLMLDRILKEVYKIGNRKILFEGEKPILESGEKNFSISHSGKYIAIGFSDSNCSLDVEEIKNRDYKKLAARMNFQSDSLEEFYRDWTMYEALYKLKDYCTTPFSSKVYSFENYTLTALSANSKEIFNLYLSII